MDLNAYITSSLPYNDTTVLYKDKKHEKEYKAPISVFCTPLWKVLNPLSSTRNSRDEDRQADIRAMRNSIIISPHPLSQVEITEKKVK